MKKRNILKKEKTQSKNADKENRRNTRLGAIIAISIGLATFSSIVFKIATSTVNIWPEERWLYWCCIILLFLFISAIFIIYYRIIRFVLIDLKRYNTVDTNYHEYDEKSDEKYSCVIIDFQFYLSLSIVTLFLMVDVSLFYLDDLSKLCGILMIAMLLLICVIDKRFLRNNCTKQNLLYGGKKVFYWIIIAFICFIFSFVLLNGKQAILEVKYEENGFITIENMSSENYDSLMISVYTSDDDVVFKSSIDRESLLFAKESKYINSEVDGNKIAKGFVINDEILYWKYDLNLDESIETDGQYILSIMVVQDTKEVTLLNMFNSKDGKFIFAENSIEKKY